MTGLMLTVHLEAVVFVLHLAQESNDVAFQNDVPELHQSSTERFLEHYALKLLHVNVTAHLKWSPVVFPNHGWNLIGAIARNC